MDKKRVIKSFENLDPELQQQFEELYPRGYEDCKDKVFRLTNARNENFFVAPMETDEAIYLVKIEVEKPKDDEEEEDNYDDKEEASSEKEDSYEDEHDLD